MRILDVATSLALVCLAVASSIPEIDAAAAGFSAC
jgi:hypothetical protein